MAARLLVAALALVVVAGCGDDGDEPARTQPVSALTAAERGAVDRAVAEIRAYCRAVARHLSGRGTRPATDQAVAAARLIAGLAQRTPEGRYRGSQTARNLAGDLAEDLEGTNCSGLLVAELERGL